RAAAGAGREVPVRRAPAAVRGAGARPPDRPPRESRGRPGRRAAVPGPGRHGLLVDVQRRLGIGPQDLLLLPLAQGPGGVVVRVALVTRRVPRQDQPDDVMRVGRDQLVLYAVDDDVVRWRGDLGESADPVPGITDSAK